MTTRFSMLTFGPALLLAALFWWLVGLTPLVSWLVAITLVTFLTFGYDKRLAGTGRMRVPEMVLFLLTALGGVVGAIAGMLIFHHKTRKRSFLIRFVIAALVSVILFGSMFFWLGWR